MSEREKLIEVMARAMCEHDLLDPEQRLKNGLVMWQSKIDAATTALTALEAAGVRLVPMEATGEMIQMAESLHTIDELTTDEYRRAYSAMIAFSPYAP